jgi:beta-glucanase (GH16 family)
MGCRLEAWWLAGNKATGMSSSFIAAMKVVGGRLVMLGISTVLAACSAQARPEQLLKTPASSAAEAGQSVPTPTIDPQSMRLSFSEEFDGPFSVSSWGCLTDWIAHTPWNGDFGDAAFADPSQGFPFTVTDGALAIEARRFDGEWLSGMLSGVDVCGGGWSQLYGYFEIRAKLPEAPGFWPSFWLVGVNPKTNGTSEIDVFEFYSAHPDGYTLGIIRHAGAADSEKRADGRRHEVEAGLLSGQYNTYGVEITHAHTVFFFNRSEIFRVPTSEEFRQPFSMFVSLAAITADMTDETPDSVKLYVDYIRAYQRVPE